jgi:hypothetical protein
MRFGTHSHDTKHETVDPTVKTKQDRLVAVLRALTDRIEHASPDRFADAASWLASAVDTLAKTVDRTLGRTK